MIISPKTAIAEGWITHTDATYDWLSTNSIQPNALDFTLDKAFYFNTLDEFRLSNSHKKMRSTTQITPKQNVDGIESLQIPAGCTVDCLSNMYLNIPTQVAALLVVRSTLNRNGIFLTSGLYDSKYTGHIGFSLHNNGPTAHIAPGTRVGQILFVKSDSVGEYSGGYNHSLDSDWTTRAGIV
jgi:deoxycytidine triphosphate deaminase